MRVIEFVERDDETLVCFEVGKTEYVLPVKEMNRFIGEYQYRKLVYSGMLILAEIEESE